MNFFDHPAAEKSITPSSHIGMKAGISVFAFILCLGGLWLLIPALVNPGHIDLPPAREAAIGLEALHPRALIAAEVSGIRGDLWAQAVFTDAELLWLDPASVAKPANAARVDSARARVTKALSLAPIDGNAWLYAAKLPATPAQPQSNVTALLTMSYMTKPSDLSLIASRLTLAASTDALSDPAIQDFVKLDLRRVLFQHPEKKSEIMAAFAKAGPQNRVLLKNLANDIDSTFAASLDVSAPPPAAAH
jgi:hypothetical protein